MRIPKKFGVRTTHFEMMQNEKRKYILAYEGQETEVQYFNGVIDNRAAIGIDPIIYLLPLLRSIPQESHSHPLNILKLVEEHVDNYNSVKLLIDKMVDYCADEDIAISKKSGYSLEAIEKDLKFYFLEIRQMQLEEEITSREEIITELAQYLANKLDLTNQIENIMHYIEEQQVLYSRDLDYICLIIDRDKGSFKENQFKELIKKCTKKNIRLFITNPAFEFWLLLHSDKVFNYNPDELLINQKEGRRRFLERVLSEVYDGYRKENIRFEQFFPDVKTAIANEKKFCEDVNELQDKLGSNIGILLSECILNN